MLTEPSDEDIAAPPAVALSWRRCAECGLRRELTRPQPSARLLPPLDGAVMLRHLAQVRPAMEDVYQFIEGSHCAIACADADARLLDVMGDAELVEELREIGFARGACWSEECAGTNGLALALLESFPTQVCGAAHYCDFLAPYCTSAAPVYDSLGGLIGGLVAVTRATNAHVHTLGMVSAAANALTSELRMNLWLSSANELLTEMNAILQTLSEGILLLTGNGKLAQMNARAGQLLGLAPARVVGRRLADVVEMPAQLSEALRQGRELHDEELVFRAHGERMACICTLRAIAAPASIQTTPPLGGMADGAGARMGLGQPTIGLSTSPRTEAGGYVLTLRSVERVQRLVHRMSGAHALMRFDNIVGQSPKLLEAIRLARIAAESASTVLLHGETGTGKEVFAQSIHNGGARATGPFVAINCAAIPRELISSELFGYESGAFTGADRQGRPGKFELANGGTLFLDEIGDMPRDLQTSLLRAIETRTIVRVGGQHVLPVDVRIIAATHRDLADEVRQGSFRSDLFFRLNVFPIEVPALRERSGDVSLLLAHVLQRLSTRLNRTLSIEAEALVALEAYDWPGNVRELENVIERAVYVSAERGVIDLDDLPEHIQDVAGGAPLHAERSLHVGVVGMESAGISPALAAGRPAMSGRVLQRESASAEAAVIARVLQKYGGNMTQASAELGINRTTLWRKRRRYHV